MTARRWREAVTVAAILFLLASFALGVIAMTVLSLSAANRCALRDGSAERLSRPALFVEVR